MSEEEFTDYRKVIGRNIQSALIMCGKNQSWLADQLDLHSSQLNGYIKGKSMPNPELFSEIANTLNLTVQELLCGEELSSEEAPSFMNKISGDDDVEDFSLENELKAELTSISNYAKTLKQSTSNDKIISLSNLIYNKAVFVKENME